MLVKNGTIVNAKGMLKADIYLELGKIRRIGKNMKMQGEETIDASGLFVLPGMVDAHVHLRDFREVSKEDYFTGTSAALAGGVTSVIDMPNNSLPTISMQNLEAKKFVAGRKAVCNYGFHFGATPDNFEEAAIAARDPSIASLKIYMGSSTGSLLLDDFSALYCHLASFKKTITLHAEDEHAIRHFSKQHGLMENEEDLRGAKHTKATIHSKIRNEMVAELAVTRALSAASKTSAKLHFAHVSTKKEVDLISAAKRKKMRITCEVSPHHIFLDDSLTKKLGNFAKVNPPLRGKKTVLELWSALKSGKIDILATDHAPHLREEKELGYWEAPSGMPGLDTALLLMLDAVNKRRLSLQKVVSLYSYMPSKVFKIYNKGEIAVGKDADLVLVDLKAKTKISKEKLFTKCGWSPYEGTQIQGAIRRTILAGKTAYDGESVISRMGEGKELRFGKI
ncbi:MAG: dihydroorotase family protein [Candidatus Micrarchaeota archaeon]